MIYFRTGAAALIGACIASGAMAAECTGANARIAPAPVIAHTVEGGATTMLLQNTGISTIHTPAEKAEQEWQHCSGLWVAQPDGTGAGSGHCYHVDDDGDIEVISWEGANGAGTWTHLYGTGKNADLPEGRSGAWTSGKAQPNGLNTGFWTGDC